MDVTRATAATRVDEDGLVDYAEILGDSALTGNNSNFDTGIGSWVTYIGGSLAHDTDKLEVTLLATGSGARINTNSLISGGQIGKTFKIRAKIWQGTTTATSLNVYLGSVQDVITISSTPTYFEVELTPTSTAYLTIYRGSSSGGTFFIDDITVKEVTRDNVPRIDYTGGGCPHILAEPQRRNLIPYSEDFSQWTAAANGTGVNPIVTVNYATSPSGEQNASRVQLDIGSGTSSDDFSQVSEVITISNSTLYSRSIYVKSNTGSNQDIVIQTNGEVITTSTITTEWQRFEASVTSDSTAGFFRIRIRGNEGTVSQADILVYGAQLEEGSYATSYIPNFGTLLGVTRNQDIFTRDGIGSLINSTEGVLFAEIAALSNTSTDRTMVSLSDGTTSNRVYIRYGNASNQIEGRSTVATANSGLTNYVVTNETNFHKVAYKWKLNDFALWVDGVEVSTSTGAVNSANTLNKLSFDSGAGTQIAEGKVKQLQVFKTADIDLAALTS
jgi:hypothetical protein